MSIVLSSAIYAQKRVYVYNFSSYDVDMSYLYTISNLDYDLGPIHVNTEQPLIFEAGQSYSYTSILPSPYSNGFPYTGFSGMT